jgi:hypothetical protein
MGKIAVWMFVRIVRWSLWLGFLGYLLYIQTNRATIFTNLNQLPTHVELAIFGLAAAAVAAGMLELAARERTGLPRPPFLGMPRTTP